MRRTRTPVIGSPAWTAQRRQAIFATDAAACVGLSRFSDPHMLYLEKLALTAPKVETERMKWGKLLEAAIAREWARGKGVVARNDPYTYWRDDLPFPMATHLDWRTDTDLVEIKTASNFAAADFGEEGTDEVPDDYRLQVAHQLAVTGVSSSYLIVLVGGNQLREYVVKRDRQLERDLIRGEQKAWQGVVNKVPPPIDGSAGASEYIRTTLGVDDGSEMELDETLQALALSYLAAGEQIKAAEKERTALHNRIGEALGTASTAKGGDIAITWRKNKDSTVIAWEQIARALAGHESRLRKAIAKHSFEKQGARPLLVKYREP